MLLAEYPWLLSQGTGASMSKNTVGGDCLPAGRPTLIILNLPKPARRQAGTAVFRPQSNSFIQ